MQDPNWLAAVTPIVDRSEDLEMPWVEHWTRGDLQEKRKATGKHVHK